MQVPNHLCLRINSKRKFVERLTIRPRNGLTNIDEGRIERGESCSSRVWPRKLIPIQNHLTREWIAHWKKRFRKSAFPDSPGCILLRMQRDRVEILTREPFQCSYEIGANALRDLKHVFAQVGIVAVLTGAVRAHGNTRHTFYAAGNHEIHRARGDTHSAKVNCL